MTTNNIIEGLTILEKYRTKKDGYNVGAEHDVLYCYATDQAVSPEDLARLVELGWFQDVDYEGDDEFASKHYDSEEGWQAYV